MNALKSHWRRLVIKVGSALIAPEGIRCSTRYLLALADFIHHCLNQNKQVVLVSSGSVAAGAGITATAMQRPLSIPQKQALAAIGQIQVMQHWQKLFDETCAQILLTRADLENPKRLQNARNTLETLFTMNALPIINENDSVVVDELVVGDNDNLAARVAVLCDADMLIICSDVDGLFDKDPRHYSDAKLLSQIDTIDDALFRVAGSAGSAIATGGMQTKLQAAQFATSQGIDTYIINGRDAASFERLKRSQVAGTWFKAAQGERKAVRSLENVK